MYKLCCDKCEKIIPTEKRVILGMEMEFYLTGKVNFPFKNMFPNKTFCKECALTIENEFLKAKTLLLQQIMEQSYE